MNLTVVGSLPCSDDRQTQLILLEQQQPVTCRPAGVWMRPCRLMELTSEFNGLTSAKPVLWSSGLLLGRSSCSIRCY
jgi:hypothetical protein